MDRMHCNELKTSGCICISILEGFEAMAEKCPDHTVAEAAVDLMYLLKGNGDD